MGEEIIDQDQVLVRNFLMTRKGNLFDHGEKPRIIAHCANDIGAFGAGFVVPLGEKYPKAKVDYRTRRDYRLGETIFSEQPDGTIVAHVIGQRGIRPMNGQPPIRLDALEAGLELVFRKARELNLPVQAPALGTGLAGGRWEDVRRILRHLSSKYMVPTTVFYLEHRLLP